MPVSLDPAPHVHVFDARGVARRFRHAAIFGAPGALRNGETMRFINDHDHDHDPIPLLDQLGQRFGAHLSISCLQRGADAVVIDFGVHGLPEG